MRSRDSDSIRIFISYSHKDAKDKEKLEEQLRVLEQVAKDHVYIETWSDSSIDAGENWREELNAALDGAAIAVLLVSPRFLVSNFILKEEVPKILERNNQDANEDFRVFPVIGRACGWQLVPWLESMQVRPTGGVPIFSHRRPRMESELAQITLEVAEAARKINIVRRFSNRDKNIAWADLKGVIGVSNTRKDNFIQVMESNRFTVVILDEENGNNTERRRLNNHIKRVTKDTQKQTENILRDLKAQRSLSEKAMLSSVKNDSMALKGSETEQNLKVAFSREAEGNRRYLYFASKAYVEGYYDIAATFRTTAEGETGHAYGHLEYLEECGDPATGLPYGGTIENLKTAIASEAFKYGEMYPGMAKIAREEGFLEIADWFETLARAKRSHLDQFLTVLDRVDV